MNLCVCVLVIIGDGLKFFSVGVDFNMFVDGDCVVVCMMVVCFGVVFEVLYDVCVVMIVVINGYVMGGGFECVFVCDLWIVEMYV